MRTTRHGRRDFGGILLTLIFVTCAAGLSPDACRAQDDCAGTLRPVIAPLVLDYEAPQGIARDGADGSFWLTSALHMRLLHLDRRLRVIDTVPLDIPPVANPFANNLNGIAYNPASDTLFVCRPGTNEIFEVHKDGTLAEFRLQLDLPPPVNVIPEPFPKGISFDPQGDGERGSFWVVESVMTAVYEVTLSGEILQSFCHPDDPDGCPGKSAAAQNGSVQVLSRDATSAQLALTGGTAYRDKIRVVDASGVPTGVSYDLAGLGGRPGGFLRTEWTPPGGANPLDVFVVSVESSSELHVVEVVEPEIRALLEPSCVVTAGTVALSWRTTETYDAIDIVREGTLLATLSGDATTFDDGAPPPGVLEYEIVARRGDCASRLACEVTVGPGEVLRVAEFDGLHVVDITEDAEGNLWVTHASNEIAVLDKELELLFFFPGPFQAPGDVTSGIAFNPHSSPDDPTFFVYNPITNVVGEMDGSGSFLAPPVPSGVPTSEETPAIVTSMLFDPAGDEGRGSFWYLDHATSTIQERTRDGNELRTCEHPDSRAEPSLPGMRLRPYAWGLSALPGGGFERLTLSGGRIRDGATIRLGTLDPTTCALTGPQLPVSGIAEVRTPFFLNLLHTTHAGREVVYAVNANQIAPRSWILEVDATPPEVPIVGELRCSQPTDAPDVELTFLPAGALDAIEVRRGGALLAEIDGAATSYVDRDVPAGRHTYSLRGRVAGVLGDDRICTVRAGTGSLATRAFSHPLALVHQAARDPVRDHWVVATFWHARTEDDTPFSDLLHFYDDELRYAGNVPSRFVLPFEIAALAVRVDGGESEYWVLGWQPGREPQGSPPRLPLRITNADGEALGEIQVTLPRPRRTLTLFPSGLAWDSGTDSLWLLERNSGTVAHVSLEGDILSSFPHPAPIHQDNVVNYGLAADGERGTLYVTSAGLLDHSITRAVEVTRSGKLTGLEIPFDADRYDIVRAIALSEDSSRLLVTAHATASGVSDLAVVRLASSDVAAVSDLTCAASAVGGQELGWSNAGAYDAIEIYRNDALATELPGDATSWQDSDPFVCGTFYRVVARRGAETSPGTICDAASPDPFLRGDVEENASVNISDAIAILGGLFLGEAPPACPDAADVNDDGAVNIADVSRLLNFLFLTGSAPAAPYPAAGCDPTEDGLGCHSG